MHDPPPHRTSWRALRRRSTLDTEGGKRERDNEGVQFFPFLIPRRAFIVDSVSPVCMNLVLVIVDSLCVNLVLVIVQQGLDCFTP